MPAFGFSAVPSPTKNRKTLPGCHPPNAAAPADATAAPNNGDTDSPVDTDAAAATVRAEPPNSRRLAAAAAHTTGAAAGESPLLPISSHDRNELLKLDAGATRAAVITGAAATTGSAACVTTAAATEIPESRSATTDSGDCGSGSDPDSGAMEFGPEFTDGEVTAAE